MHILTGLLVTHLMNRKRKDKGSANRSANRSGSLRSPLLRSPTVLSVTHALPGRTRFRVPVLVGATRAAGKLEQALRGIEGIVSVTVSPATGTVLVEHDAQRVPVDVLAAALVRLLGLERELTREVEAKFGREVREITRAANRAVYEQTGGLLDLKTVLFCGLALLGTQQMLQGRSLALPTGFTLLWWAGNGLLRGKQPD